MVKKGGRCDVDLPALESIRLGRHALEGDATDKSSSVEMRSCFEVWN